MATDKQIDLFDRLKKDREFPADFVVDSIAEMDTYEASQIISKTLALPVKAGSKTAKERESIAGVTDGVYTLTAKQAATVLNYKGEPYFGEEKTTVKVNHTKTGAFWVERVSPNHPIKDSTARRSIMLLLSKKSPKATAVAL
jgi:hypothetical protein